VLLLDLLFIEPRYTLLVARPEDVWALALLFVIGAIVSTVAAQARQRAVEAQEAADRAEALRALAHVVIQRPSKDEILGAAADTLGRLFSSPAVVLLESGGALRLAAQSQGARVTADDEQAARAALDSGSPTRADAFPVDRSRYDFWPVVPAGADFRFVLGVGAGRDRPEQPSRLVELVGGYIASALTLPRG
jgi:two-component system sensor histidine kinase KdpD